MLYFSHGSTDFNHFHTLYLSIHTTYPATFIKITDMVSQIQRLKL